MPFKCTKCDSSFQQKRTLDQHMMKECGVPFNCSECNKNFATKGSLRVHLLGVHEIVSHQLEKFGAGMKLSNYTQMCCPYTFKGKISISKIIRVPRIQGSTCTTLQV